ncbi:hypothetical protein SAY87_001985 [Trapa incisa]|uniref:GH18 domain-containing protein n=1 Tax=Trapa incisa TaxID=236973 RepID=A0AAN7JU76_9MYRT|nr:hypothetical protein SAY87_001985 [Trapa incisa]
MRRPPLLLTAAVYFASDFFLSDVYRAYPAGSIARNLDFINAMCYDYHGSWNTSATGAHAAFYDPTSNVSSSYGLSSWVRAGVPRSKVIMELPLYGKTWKLKDPNINGVGAPAVGVGPGDVGILFYYQVVAFNRDNGAKVVFDRATVSSYSYAGTTWIGYDDVTSTTTTKIMLAKNMGLGGYFFWALSYDVDWQISIQGLGLAAIDGAMSGQYSLALFYGPMRIKKKLAKKMRQNRPIPHWIRMRTDNTIRFDSMLAQFLIISSSADFLVLPGLNLLLSTAFAERFCIIFRIDFYLAEMV